MYEYESHHDLSDDTINKMASNGWRLIAVVRDGDYSKQYFERLKPNSTELIWAPSQVSKKELRIREAD
jgi:hypothetical protein